MHGAVDTASGLVVVPDEGGYAYPMLVYQHGTVADRYSVPSSNATGDAAFAQIYGGMGYVVVATDYLGLGESRGFHPYVHAATEASAAVDMMRAVRDDFSLEHDVLINEQVFVTGYSQGGHAAMALHRELETKLGSEFHVTASAPMSGPYSISGVMREVALAEKEYFYPGFLPFTILGYQTAYGNLYDDLADVFKPDYLPMVQKFADEEIDLLQLNDFLVNTLIQNHGESVPRYMFVDSLINEVEINPDHPFNVALRDNDVYDWAPQASTRLYYCMADDQVPYLNSVLADSVMNANGAPNVLAIDLDSDANHAQCAVPALTAGIFFFGVFQRIDAVTATTERDALPEVQLFPNPASELLFLQNLEEETTIELYDLLGRSVLRQTLAPGNHTLDVGGYERGTYLLRLKVGAREGVRTVLLQ